MSNPLAISTVSAAFLRRILAAAVAAVPNANVRLGAPTAKLAEDAAPLVNLHLYRVEPNAAHVNDHLPSRTGAGVVRRPSTLALNLHYILSFYGDHTLFEPDRILAQVMLHFEHEPLLSRTTVANAIAQGDTLEDSDLDRAAARLRVTRQLMSLDDFSKVWSIFYQVPYALSLAYEVNHVVIESDDVAPLAMPVAHPAQFVSPMAALRLDSAGNPLGAAAPVVWGGTLRLTGRGLGQPGLGLEIDGVPLVMDAVTATATEMTVPMTAAIFGGEVPEIGIHRVRAVAPASPADQPDHLRMRSNTLAFALGPDITLGAVTEDAGTGTRELAVAIAPPVGPGQPLRLLLDNRDPAAPAQVAVPAEVTGDAAVEEVAFDITGVPAGAWLVRAEVDGLVSPVVTDTTPGSATFGQITGPELVL